MDLVNIKNEKHWVWEEVVLIRKTLTLHGRNLREDEDRIKRIAAHFF